MIKMYNLSTNAAVSIVYEFNNKSTIFFLLYQKSFTKTLFNAQSNYF